VSRQRAKMQPQARGKIIGESVPYPVAKRARATPERGGPIQSGPSWLKKFQRKVAGIRA
jgi:hypothetical protein